MSVTLEPIHKRTLVADAERIADVASRKHNQVSQLRNVLTVSQTESEIPVLKNFLEYQAGRQATYKFWRPIHKDVIEVLEKVGGWFPDEEDSRRSRAVQSFFGYMVRRYVYKTELARERGGGRGGYGQHQGRSQHGKGGSR